MFSQVLFRVLASGSTEASRSLLPKFSTLTQTFSYATDYSYAK